MQAHDQTRHRRRRKRLVACIALALGWVLLGAHPASADIDGLDIVSDTTFAPDPDAGVIRVRATYVLTNEKPTQYFATYSQSFYFNSFVALVPEVATDITAVVDGTTASVRTEPLPEDEDASVVLAVVTLPRSLWYGQQATVAFSYALPNGEARSGCLGAVQRRVLLVSGLCVL